MTLNTQMALWRLGACALVIGLLGTGQPAAAQSNRRDVSVHVVVETLRELESTDVGLSGRLGWRLSQWLTVEGEAGMFPVDLPVGRPVTAARAEVLAGVTVGPTLRRLRPYARLRAGGLRVAASPGPVACILIFPPPLTCELAGGRSMFAIDIGGGVEISVSPRAFARVDIGNRLARFPGPAFDGDHVMHDGSFSVYDLRIAVGAGWRF